MTDERETSPKITTGLPAAEVMSSPQRCPLMVGIGASAGGQVALERIFTAMPTDCGIAFVVIMHIPAHGPSFLAEMLGRYTPMPVVTAAEGMELTRDTVHVIPAGRDITVSDGRFRLEEPEPGHWHHHPIDRFFHSLAAEFGEHAVAVVLSGFGLDGAAGAKGVKDAGGIVIVQDPASALTPAMPNSAIAAGGADFVLPAEEIPWKIAEIARGTCSLPAGACQTATLDEELRAVFAIMKGATGHDFSSYKASTVLRRIERRMAVNEVAGIKRYVAFLQDNTQEAFALSQDILIGVTGFFRDPEAFETVRQVVIPRLFADRHPADTVRIWHACCATGEEVYSMAFLIREYLDEHGIDARVQFFATDIDDAAVSQARTGLYDEGFEAEVGEERLKRFFTRVGNRWQVVKSVREMIVFAHHSLLKNPPFSRLDLLVCRNFLIYLTPDMQKRLISLFHQVLEPNGFLFLGAAEAVGRHSDLFTTVDKKWKIFERREGGKRGETLFPFATPIRFPGAARLQRGEAEEPTPGALAERLLVERYSPPCVIVNEKYEVIHVSTRANRFLEVPVGEPTRDILRMAREELRPALRAAIYKAFAERKEMAFRGVKVGGIEGEPTVNVLVEPLDAPPSAGKLAMVVFEPAAPEVPAMPAGGEGAPPIDDASRDVLIRQLEEQLRVTHEQLQATAEQLETAQEGFLTANEELLSMNEEYQSANEELQSANEELETSKEELQALNEELVTVNAELQGKVEELNQATSDMENLLASSGIATLFLDRQMNIKGFTPAAAAIFSLIPADIGRPFRHLAGKVDWPTLAQDAETVLAGEPFTEREVTTLDEGRCYLKRVFPYRSAEGRIDGIVVTLIDITERKRTDDALQESKQRVEEHLAQLQAILDHLSDGIVISDLKGNLFHWNPAAVAMHGFTSMEECQRSLPEFADIFELSTDEEGVLPLVRWPLSRIQNGETLRSWEVRVHRRATDWQRVFSYGGTLACDEGGQPLLAVVSVTDITERKQVEEALRRSKEEWERTFDSVPDLIAIMDKDHRIIRVNRAMAERLGTTAEQCIGQFCYKGVHGVDQPPDFCPHTLTMQDRQQHEGEVYEGRLGGDFLISTTPLLDERGEMTGTVHVARDITERKRAEEALKESEERLRRAQEIAHLGSWELDLVNNNLSWSDEVYRIFGLQPQEFGASYEAFLEAVHPDDRAAVDAAYAGSLREGTNSYEIEHRVVRSTGEVRIVHEKCEHIRNGSGLIVRSVGMVHDITERKRAEEALRESESRVRKKLESILSPEGEMENLDLADIIDAQSMQSLMDNFYRLTSMPMAMIDLKGEVLVGVGWQDICTKFHRINPETCKNCIESDIQLSAGVPPGEFKLYKCKNNMWDVATPIMVGGRHFGNFFMGQFFFEDEPLDYDFFRAQAKQYGFDEQEYIACLERVPRMNRESLAAGMAYFMELADMLSRMSYSNLKLAKSLAERDNLMDSLGKSEEQFRTMANAIPQLCWIANADGWIFWYNQRWYDYTGTTPEQMEGWGWQSVHDPQVLPNVMERWQASISTGKPFDMIFPLRGADDVFRPFLTRVLPVRDQDGTVVRWFGTNTDITEQRTAEEALHHSNARLDLLAETAGKLLMSDSPQAIVDELCRKVMAFLDCHVFFNFLADEEAGRLHLNACEGIPNDEKEKIEWLDYGVAVCGCAARDACRIVAEDIPNTQDPRTDLVKSYGIQAYACHPLMSQGKVIGTLSFGTRTRSRFSDDELALMKAVADQVAIAMERKRTEEALRKAHDELEQRVEERTNELASALNTLQDETVERIRAVQELRRQEQMFQQQSRQAALGEMIGNIAHQWRQPLNVLGLIIQELPLMHETGEFTADYLAAKVEKAKDVISHMSRTIDDFRNFFRPDKEKVSFRVSEAITRTLSLIEGSFDDQEIAVEVDAAKDPLVNGYPNEFSQVLLNILINARDAFMERDIPAPRTVTITLADDGGKPVMTIADNAGGIPAEIIDKIFDPYFTTKGPDRGTGIGLFMAKTIIEKNMHGRLTARNAGQGAEFRIEV